MPPQRRHNTRRDPTSAPPPSLNSQPQSGPGSFNAAAASSSTTTGRGSGLASEQAMTSETGIMASTSRGLGASSSRKVPCGNATTSSSSSTMLETFASAEAAIQEPLTACQAAGGLSMVRKAKTKWTLTCGSLGDCKWEVAVHRLKRSDGRKGQPLPPERWYQEVVRGAHNHSSSAVTLSSTPRTPPSIKMELDDLPRDQMVLSSPAPAPSQAPRARPSSSRASPFYPNPPPKPSPPTHEAGLAPREAPTPNGHPLGLEEHSGEIQPRRQGSKRTRSRAFRRERTAARWAAAALEGAEQQASPGDGPSLLSRLGALQL